MLLRAFLIEYCPVNQDRVFKTDHLNVSPAAQRVMFIQRLWLEGGYDGKMLQGAMPMAFVAGQQETPLICKFLLSRRPLVCCEAVTSTSNLFPMDVVVTFKYCYRVKKAVCPGSSVQQVGISVMLVPPAEPPPGSMVLHPRECCCLQTVATELFSSVEEPHGSHGLLPWRLCGLWGSQLMVVSCGGNASCYGSSGMTFQRKWCFPACAPREMLVLGSPSLCVTPALCRGAAWSVCRGVSLKGPWGRAVKHTGRWAALGTAQSCERRNVCASQLQHVGPLSSQLKDLKPRQHKVGIFILSENGMLAAFGLPCLPGQSSEQAKAKPG